MKKLLALSIFTIFVSTSYAQVQIYGRYTTGGKVVPDFNYYGEKKLSKKVNLTFFALIEQKYAEAYIGFSYAPKDWMSFGFSAGIESNPGLYRTAASLWFGKKKNSLLILLEKGDGTDNYWYKTTLQHKFSDKFSLAARAWRYHGEGVVAIYNIKKLDTKVWAMPCYDLEYQQKRLIFGVDIKL